MPLTLTGTKKEIQTEVEHYITDLGFTVVASDFERPWGGFLVLDEGQAKRFAEFYFPGIEISSLQISGKLSPKILVVQPNKRLSWQYHFRRAEIWKLIAGTAGVVTSLTDEQGEVVPLQLEEIIRLAQGQRHRLVGLSRWGVVAEIWQHTDSENPSDEDDIVRLQDDFGR